MQWSEKSFPIWMILWFYNKRWRKLKYLIYFCTHLLEESPESMRPIQFQRSKISAKNKKKNTEHFYELKVFKAGMYYELYPRTTKKGMKSPQTIYDLLSLRSSQRRYVRWLADVCLIHTYTYVLYSSKLKFNTLKKPEK